MREVRNSISLQHQGLGRKKRKYHVKTETQRRKMAI
jgi:hypothetical protein